MGWEEVFNKQGLRTNLEKTGVMWVGRRCSISMD